MGQIAFQQDELFGRGLGLDEVAGQVGVAGQHLALRPAENELGHGQAHRDAGVARITGRAVGDILAAAETRLGQLVIDVGAVEEGQVGEDLALGLTGQIGAGGGRRHVEAKLAMRDVPGHASSPASDLAQGVTRCRP